jgi:hypothetical protein
LVDLFSGERSSAAPAAKILRMKELQAKLERLLAEAQDCDLIGNLATDQAKRATFRRMAAQFREMAEQLKADIAARVAQNGEA